MTTHHIANALIAAAQFGHDIAPVGLESACALLAIGVTMFGPLVVLTLVTLRCVR